jgi:hypothetical protein
MTPWIGPPGSVGWSSRAMTATRVDLNEKSRPYFGSSQNELARSS